MNFRWIAMGAALTGSALLSGCKDKVVRLYIREELRPYLDSLAYQLCVLKYDQAPTVPGEMICTGPPRGYTKPPENGDP